MTALTIGMFDGVHRGHQLLLQKLFSLTKNSSVITFENHPKSILHKNSAPKLLTLPWLKKKLLQHYGACEVTTLLFTELVASQSFDKFLEPFVFKHLMLGEGAVLGKDRLGTLESLKELGKKRDFLVHSLPKLKEVSSTRIRHLIQNAKLNEAQIYLGRPHLLYYGGAGVFTQELLPPKGIYPVWSYSTGRLEKLFLTIGDQIELSLNTPQWISFSPHIHQELISILWQAQTSPAVS